MIGRVLGALGSLRVTVVGLSLLLVLTVWGTLYQVDHGLYLAQERFYQSWSFPVAGVIPFPGAQLVMAILFVNLGASMLCLARQGRLRRGQFTTHLGLILMLAAGAVTFYWGKSASLSLAEGEGSNVAISYNEWELALLPAPSGTDTRISTLNARALRPGRTTALPGNRLAIRVEAYYRNCEADRKTVENPPENSIGFTALEPKPPHKEPAEDMPGLIFTLLEDGREKGRFLVWGGSGAPVVLPTGNLLSLRRQRLPLPAMVQLVDFRREMHPGSGIAKSYSSQVLVRSGEGLDRKVLISMNKPLRLQGYTFYQSSFSSDSGGREISTLAVVHNFGRMIPYIATGTTAAGMLLHFTGMLITRLRRRVSQEGPA
jgi:hypothetical protein